MRAFHFPTPQPSTNRRDDLQVATCLSHAEPMASFRQRRTRLQRESSPLQRFLPSVLP